MTSISITKRTYTTVKNPLRFHTGNVGNLTMSVARTISIITCKHVWHIHFCLVPLKKSFVNKQYVNKAHQKCSLPYSKQNSE